MFGVNYPSHYIQEHYMQVTIKFSKFLWGTIRELTMRLVIQRILMDSFVIEWEYALFCSKL